MTKTVAVANQKGGVGKTTTTVNLAAACGAAGKKVLLIDADPQGNTTSAYGYFKKSAEQKTTYSVLTGEAEIESAIQRTNFKNVSILTSNVDLAAAEIELAEISGRESVLKHALEKIKEAYDFIFIDCPPSLNLITINALTAADSVLVPIQCEFFALEGLSQLMNTVRRIKKLYNPTLDIEGVLLTMYDGRLNLTLQVAGEIKKFFPGKVFKTAIPRNVRLSEAPSYGMPVIYFDKYSKGAESYTELAAEFIRKNRK
ncbi:MAG: AAA family ATPase [Bacillota bacterium]|nr:AAA family ATPase [Bacillota bacterium]